jgi:hypothetical protein
VGLLFLFYAVKGWGVVGDGRTGDDFGGERELSLRLFWGLRHFGGEGGDGGVSAGEDVGGASKDKK